MLSHANIAREILLLFLVAYFLTGWKVFRTAMNPLAVAVAPWLAMIAAQEFLEPSMYCSWLAAAIIAGALLCVGLGTLIVMVYLPGNGFVPSPAKLEPVLEHRWLRYCVFGLILSGVGLHVGVTYYYGILHGVGLSSTGTFVSYELFDQVLNSAIAWPYRIASTMLQLGAVICSLELQSKRPAYLVVISYLSLTTLESVFIASRFGLYLVYSAVILGWVVFAAQRYRRLSLRLVMFSALALILAAAVYGFTTSRRTGSETRDTNQMMAAGLISPPSVFSGILTDHDEWITGTLEGNTFHSLLLFVTKQDRGSWNYDPYSIAPDMSETSNLVTGLWQLLADFGISGTVIILTLMGAVSTRLFTRFNAQPTAKRAGSLLCIYLLLFWLPVVVLTHYMYFWCIAPVLFKADLLYRVGPGAGMPTPGKTRDRSLPAKYHTQGASAKA